MNTLTTAALAGTSQRPPSDLASGTEVDALAATLPIEETERKLLLQAGALAVYRLAGRLPGTLIETPAPAPAETLPVCSPAVAEILRQLLSGRNADLLPEALERVRAAGLRLPPDLLPLALRQREREPRQALVHVLGARGRWLAAQNTAWSWVAQTLVASAETLPDDAETMWQEGTPVERLGILRQLRASDPARGREWLAAVWKQEKADTRAALIETFATGLGPDDEAFLEAALDDRAAAVRDAARSLLARIPASAFTARMRARADAVLVMKGKRLDADPPAALPKDWARDGISAKPLMGVGERAFWLAQVIRFVPPSHWQERFARSAEDVIGLAAKTDWEEALIHGWTQAVLLYGTSEWAMPLWERWCMADEHGKAVPGAIPAEMRLSLAALLAPGDMEAVIRRLIAGTRLPGAPKHPNASHGHELIQALPLPWNPSFAQFYLARVRAYAKGLSGTSHKNDYAYTWESTIEYAAKAIPPSCFADALVPFDIPDPASGKSPNWYLHRFQQQLDAFADAIRIRQRIHEEIRV